MKSERRLTSTIAVLGVLTYTYLMFLLPAGNENEQIGTFIYNYYFLSLINGKLDIPIQIITLEGHYNSSGQAFVYHGIGPLITRAIAYPFIDLTKISLAPITVWFFSVTGSASYHLLFLRVLSRFGPNSPRHRMYFSVLLGLMVWFTSPGIYLTLNDSIFHEPIAMCYFAVSGFLLLFSGPALFNTPWKPILVPLAIFAGLALLTRPHVAIGLYAAVVLLLLLVLRENGRRALPYVLATLFVLLIFGVSQITLNELRFDGMLKMHGSLYRDSVEYGYVYFGLEEESSPRNLAFSEHGTFDIARIIPNGMLYLFAAPDITGAPVLDKYGLWLQNSFLRLTANLGYIRQEPPHMGLVFLWLPWIFLIVGAIRFKQIVIQRWWIVMLGALIASLFMLAYGTITLRYRTDIWPLIATVVVYSLPNLWEGLEMHPIKTDRVIFLTVLTFAFSASISITLISPYAGSFTPNRLQGRWSQETCATMVAGKETLGSDAVEKLCIIKMD